MDLAFAPYYALPPGRTSGRQSRSSSPTRLAATRKDQSAPAAKSLSGTVSPIRSASASRTGSRLGSRRGSVEQALFEDTPQRRAIREAVIRRDAEELRRLSVKGFVHDAMRRLVWPLLLNASTVTLPPIRIEDILRRRKKLETKHEEHHTEEDGELIEHEEAKDAETQEEEEVDPTHRDEYQVELDVNRSFVTFPIDETRERRRVQLSELIVSTLRKYPALNYFQGYHDIISIVLLVSDDDMELASRLTARLSLFHIRDSMMTGLDPAIGYLRLLKRILKQADPPLAAAVEQASALPYFSLSWVLTLLAHDLTSIEITSRIFDFLLAHNPAMVSYVCAAIVIAKKDDLDALDPDVADDPATLHTTLAKLPNLTADPPSSTLHPHHPHSHSHHNLHAITPISAPSSPSLPNSPRLTIVSEDIEPSKLSLNGHIHEKSNSSDSLHLHTPPPRRTTTYASRRRPPPPLPLETLFNTAVHLWETFPLSHPEIQASTIFGPLSAVYTWDKHDLTDEEAEKIVLEGTEVIIPESVEEESKEDLEKLEKIQEGDADTTGEIGKRKRELQTRRLMRGVLGMIDRNTTVFALVGLAGVLIALYMGEDTATALGLSNSAMTQGSAAWWWMRNNWLVKLGVSRI